MTPARKAALQWFHDRGEVKLPSIEHENPTPSMLVLLIKDGQLTQISHKRSFVWMGEYSIYSLTDKGRSDLHEASQ